MPLHVPGYKSDEEKFQDALKYIDELFDYFPMYGDFEIYKKVHDLGKVNGETKDLVGCQPQLVRILKAEGYAVQGTFQSQLTLTPKGRNAKIAGGHAAYQKYLEEEKAKITCLQHSTMLEVT